MNNEDLTPGDVITNGNVAFQLMNLKITGNANVKAIDTQMSALSEALSEQARVTKECEIINNEAKLYLCYADNNQIIAKIIAFPVQQTDTYWTYVYVNGSWQQQLITETWWEVSLRFKFKDDSTADMDTYFGTGFEGLIQEVKDYLATLESEYGA